MKKLFYVLFLFSIFIFIEIYSYSSAISKDLSNSFFRLHIIANSNSKEDQEIKFVIRDKLMNYLSELTSNNNNLTKSQIQNIMLSNLDKITIKVNEILKNNNFSYTANSQIGTFYFPTKHYSNLSLPAGYYDSIKINLGKAEGQNWWCSLYPPLCFADLSAGTLSNESNEYLNNILSEDEFNLITTTSEKINFKFKIVELFNQ